MARKEFETVVAMAPRKRLSQIDISHDIGLPAGGFHAVYCYAPANMIGRVSGLLVQIPAVPNATSGTQNLYIGYDLDNNTFGTMNLDMARYEQSYSTSLIIQNSTITASNKQPTDDNLMGLYQNIIFDSKTPLFISYKNGSNVSIAEGAHKRTIALALALEEVTN